MSYVDEVENFIKNHHGQFVKLTDENGKVFGYIFRCEANPGNKKLIVFSITSLMVYASFKPYFCEETKKIELKPIYKRLSDVKKYIIKRMLIKWKKIKENEIFNYNDLNEKSIRMNSEQYLNNIISLYNEADPNKFKINSGRTIDYIVKEYNAIKKYYKKTDDIKVIFL